MDHPQAKETTCKHCDEVFPSKGKYQSHYRRVHQNEVKINNYNQKKTSVHRSEEEKFVCICNKGYDIWQSLHRHQRTCQQWKDHEATDIIDSDSDICIQGKIYMHLILINI